MLGRKLKKLAVATGTGWKAYMAGIGLMLYGIVVGIDSIGIDIPNIEGTLKEATQLFLQGLAVFGIRSRMDNN